MSISSKLPEYNIQKSAIPVTRGEFFVLEIAGEHLSDVVPCLGIGNVFDEFVNRPVVALSLPRLYRLLACVVRSYNVRQ